MFQSAGEHLLAELRRLDLHLLQQVLARDRSLEPAPGRRYLTSEDVLPLLTGEDPQLNPQDGALTPQLVASRLESLEADLLSSVNDSLEQGSRLPLVELCGTLKLDGPSLAILMLALAPHFDRKYERIFAYLQDDLARVQPRMALALTLFARSDLERLELRTRLEPGSPLLSSGFFFLEEPSGGLVWTDLGRVLTVSSRLVRFVLEHPGAEPLVELMRARAPLPLPIASQWVALQRFGAVWDRSTALAERGQGHDVAPVAVLRSADYEPLLEGASRLAEARGRDALLLDVARPAAAEATPTERIRVALEEAQLTGALLVLGGFDELSEEARRESWIALTARLETFDGPVMLISERGPELHRELRRRPVLLLEVPPMSRGEQLEAWRHEVTRRNGAEGAPAPDARSLRELSSRFRLSSSQIRDALAMAGSLEATAMEGTTALAADPLLLACQVQSRHRLGELAQRVTPRHRWEHLVLPSTNAAQLWEIVSFLRHRDQVFSDWGFGIHTSSGRGLTALFSGPPGTGKTMAASLIAGALDLEIFRIDLSGVVSKYIGETEKNLERIFQAAYRSNAILFFDEADALFGRRTEVRDAHDRYANIEVSYLLQRMEEFDGISILATNLRKNIDPAFLRRIGNLVEFPAPDQAHRRKLWQILMPEEMPRDEGIDFDFLAQKFDLTGGHIRNAIQTAAMMAASEGTAVRFGDLLLGVRRELTKQGKICSPADFGTYAPLVRWEANGKERVA